MKTSRYYFISLFFIFLFPFLTPSQENTYHSGEGSVFILDKAITEVYPSGKVETIIHQKIKIVGEKGKKFGELQISFDAERQRVRIISAHTITADKKILKVSSKSIKTVTPAELVQFATLYPGIKTLTVTFPGIEIGSLIEYEYKITTYKPLIKGHFWDGFYFQSTEPFVQSIYILKIPKERKIYFKECGVKLKEKKVKGKWEIYTWEKENVPSLIPEIHMPPLGELVPRVYVTTFKSWEEIGNWFYKISMDSLKESPEMIKTATALTEGKTPEEKIKNIYHYVCSNIRYVGLEMGIHGYKPHSAEEVFKFKYGDCKDKAALMVTMLKIAGIKGYITLVNTRKKMIENIPFPGQFNHAIVAIPYQGKNLFLDPTSEVFRFPGLPPSDQDKYVLIATPENQSLSKTPLFPPEENCKIRYIEAVLDKKGDLKANVKIILTGIFEAIIKDHFRYLKDVERKRGLARELNQILPGTKLLQFEVKGIEKVSLPVEENYSFQTKGYGIKVGEKMIFQPSVIDRMHDTGIVSQEKRTFPIRFSHLWETQEIVKCTIPSGFKPETIPPALEIQRKFGYFSARIEVKNNVLIYRRILSIKSLEISPQDYPEFKQFYEEISQYDKLPVILTLGL